MPTTMTKPSITQLDRGTVDKLNTMLSRIKGQLFNMPGAAYLGSLLCNHKFTWELTGATAWCDGKTICHDANFFLRLRPTARVFVLAHELWHTGYGHHIRRQGRCPDIWNIAADYVINNMLDSQGYDLDVGFQVYMDHRFDNMTTEQVYDILISEGMKPFDMPDMSGVPLFGDVKDLPGVPGSAAHDAAVQEVVGTMIAAQQAAIQANQAGSLPGEVALMIDSFLKPKLDWRKILRKYFTALSKDDYSWRRPSRRSDEYLPSLVGDNGLEHIIYYLDVSGSISDGEIKRFNSEVRAIHKNLKPELLTLVTFDTELHDIYKITKDQPFDSIEVHGRGGTCLECVQAHIKEHKPTAAVIFSDLYVEPMVDNPGVPIVWVVMDNSDAQTHFGKMIHLDREDLAA